MNEQNGAAQAFPHRYRRPIRLADAPQNIRTAAISRTQTIDTQQKSRQTGIFFPYHTPKDGIYFIKTAYRIPPDAADTQNQIKRRKLKYRRYQNILTPTRHHAEAIH